MTLAISAQAMGEYGTARQHMDGLHKMVTLRGGLSAFTDKKLLLDILRIVILVVSGVSSPSS